MRPEFVAAYQQGTAGPDTSADPYDVSFYYALASGDPDRIDRSVVGAAERAFVRWVDEVCLDEENGAFEREPSPFADRETEVLRAITVSGLRRVTRGWEADS